MNNNSTSSSNQACAACKFQRRRCSADCSLARFFPAEHNQRFMTCKRLFGVSNMIRFLKEADSSEKDDTMKSLIFEADARARDPVHGCLGIVNCLKEQVHRLQEELHSTRQQLHMLEQQHSAATLYQHHLPHSLVATAPSTLHAPATCQNVLPPHLMPLAVPYAHPNLAVYMDMDAGLDYESRPSAYNDQGQEYFNISRQTYEPRFCRFNDDLSLSVEHMVNQMPEHELKSAAALFSLTSTKQH